MTVANAQRFPRLQRLVVQVACLCTALFLTACGLSKQDTAVLLPPSVIAEAKLRAQAEDLACKTSPGKSTGCPPIAVSPVPLETGSIPQTVRPPLEATLAVSAAGTPKPTAGSAGREELYIDFQPGSVTLSDREKFAIKDAVGARLLSGDVRLRISAARGGTGNLYEQATIADKRARVVNGILPNKLVDSVEFDPDLPEDTVRLEFNRPAKRTN